MVKWGGAGESLDCTAAHRGRPGRLPRSHKHTPLTVEQLLVDSLAGLLGDQHDC